MKKENSIIVNREDLLYQSRSIPIELIKRSDLKLSREDINMAAFIFFTEKGEMKVLKSKYHILKVK